ncbi:MAG: hypothetical protein JKY66_02835 [Spongiibacteraceae bacterium]|nr:hypothetical protein [Spongiibacteraceae bacterium]
MKRNIIIVATTCLFCLAALNVYAEVNWRRGSLYFEQVCNACHQQAGQSIAPDSRTKAEWQAYIKADNHSISNNANDRVSYYTIREYRELMEPSIPALVLFFDQQASDILLDISAHLHHHAKDSDMPSSCKD